MLASGMIILSLRGLPDSLFVALKGSEGGKLRSPVLKAHARVSRFGTRQVYYVVVRGGHGLQVRIFISNFVKTKLGYFSGIFRFVKLKRMKIYKITAGCVLALCAMPMSGKAVAGEIPDTLWLQAEGVELRAYPYELKLRHAFNLATMSRTSTPGVQVELRLDSIEGRSGVTGYGEASMPPYLGESVESVMTFLSRVEPARLSNPFAMERIHAYLDSLSAGDCAAKAAIDIALHDAAGKLLGTNWTAIHGLQDLPWPTTSFTISQDTPDVLLQKIREAEPYGIIKVKMGVPGDRELIETIRRHTDKPICVDANQGWKTREEALDNILWLAERNVIFVEQPMARTDPESHAWLKERSPLPIIADEAVQRLADVAPLARAYDGINIKLMKCGGLHEAYKMAVAAKALGMKVMLGCMTETSLAVSAMAQLAPLADWVDLDGNLLISNDPFTGMSIIEGRVTPSTFPGVGAAPLKGMAKWKLKVYRNRMQKKINERYGLDQ